MNQDESSWFRRLNRVRDLTVLEVNQSEMLVVACDSDGGIGSKPLDVVQIDPFTLGMFAVRVPLLELIASGARPFLVIDCLAVEMEPYGKEILAGIKAYSQKAGLVKDEQFTGTSEENIPTQQTALGVTVLGVVPRDQFRPGQSQTGDLILCAGLPKCGPHDEVRMDDEEIISIEVLQELASLPVVHDLLPVGSKGIQFEAEQLAASAQLTYLPAESIEIDVKKSAGPATCAVFSMAAQDLPTLRQRYQLPIHVVGQLSNVTVNKI